MRKEAKQNNKRVELARIQGYHEGGSYGTQSYAFVGFKSNKLFTSDRTIALDEHFNRPDGLPLDGYGLEIETECTAIDSEKALAQVFDKIIFPLFPADLFKMQHDGSLQGKSSAECITQVMKKSFIRNHYKDFKTMWNEWFPAFHIRTDSYATGCSCGMHVNISNSLFGKTVEKQTEAIRKLYYIINKHYNLFCKALYRNPAKTHWCGQMDYSNAKTLNLYAQPNDHGLCMNLSHFGAGRIEIRLVGGQKDFWCFRNTMETIFHLVDKVKTISWKDCDDVVKIFSGCNQYVMKRLDDCGLSAHDYVAIKETVKTEELL